MEGKSKSPRVDFDRGIYRLASYARAHGHANPKFNETWLDWRVGLWVYSLRRKYRQNKLTPEQIQEALDVGVRFTPPYRPSADVDAPKQDPREQRMLDKLESLSSYFDEHGDINVPQNSGTSDWPNAGQWISYLRRRYKQGSLPDSVIDKADQLNISWSPGQGSRPQG